MKRRRNVLALALTCALAAGCARDYVMPPARVRLPGYQVESLYSEGLCVVSEHGDLSRGYMDLEGRIVIRPRYFAAGRFNGGLAAVRETPWDRYGYIDRHGRVAIAPRFDAALAFADDLAPVRIGGQWGFIDRQGRDVVPPRFDMAFAFADGRARVVVEGRAGFIDPTGKVVVEPKFFRAEDYHEGLAMVCDGLAAVKFSDGIGANDWGYIDTNGAVIIAPRFKDAGSFANGLAYVEAVTNGNWIIPAVINRAGEVVVDKPFLFEWSRALFGVPSLEQFRLRRQMVFDGALVPRRDGTVNGYMDAANRLVIPGGRFQTMGVFREGRAPVSIGGRFGYIDASGQVVAEPQFDAAGPFHEGLAAVRDEVGRTGYIRPDGAWAIEPIWLEEAHPFAAGRARVKLNGQYGFLDATGRLAVPPRYLRAEDFHEGLAVTALPAPVMSDEPR